jgi:hypothetical protein
MQYLKEISRNDNVVSSEIMKTIELNKRLTRPMDRKKLGLKPMYKSESESESEIEGEIESERDKMKKLINMWWGKKNIIAKVLSFLYENEIGVSEIEVKEFIKNTGTQNITSQYQELFKKDRGHSLVFERTSNEITKLRKEAREYIDNM